MKKSFLLAPLLGAVLLTGAGCAPDAPGTSGDAAATLPEPTVPASPAPAPAAADAVRLPLDPYVRLAEGRQDTLTKAGDILTAKCMRGKGFDYVSEDNPGGSGKDVAPLPGYGVNDLKQARESGYTPPGSGTLQSVAEQGGKVPTLDDAVQKHGAAWVKALYGFAPPETNGAGGCFEASIPPVPEYDKLDKEMAGRLAGQAADRTRGDSRVVAATAAWSTCMTESGFQYKSPIEPRQQKWPTPRNSSEIATAVADVTCKQRTNLPGIWLAVESGYQQALLDKNAPALNQLRDAWQLVIKQAEQVIANGG